MENVILGLFIGIPALVVLAALAAIYHRRQQTFEVDDASSN